MTIKLVPDTVMLGVADTRKVAIIGAYQSITFNGDTSIATATLNTDASITISGIKLGYYALTVTADDGSTAKVYVTVATDDQVDEQSSDYMDYTLPDSDFINIDDTVPEATEDQPAPDDETIDDDTQTQLDDELAALEALFPLPADSEFVYARDADNGIQGIVSSDLGDIITEQVVLPISPSISENTQNVSGAYGSHWLGDNYGAKTININIISFNKNQSEYSETIKNISNALINLGQEEHSLVLGAHPDLTFFGHFSAFSDPVFINKGKWDFSATLTFTCSDPKAYLETESAVIDASPTDITPSGNAEAQPLIHYEFLDDVKQFGYSSSQGGSVTVGFDENTPVGDLKPRVYRNDMNDLAGGIHQITDKKAISWQPSGVIRSDATFGLSNAGEAIVAKRYYAVKGADFGKDTGWLGGLLLTDAFNTKTPSGDYAWESYFNVYHLKHYSRSMGRVEFYLLDKDGKRVGRVGIKDQVEGRASQIYVLLGANDKEEQDNLKKGMGYFGSGNTDYLKKTQKDGKNKTVKVFGELKVPGQLNRTVTETFTNVWYNGKIYNDGQVHYGDKKTNVSKYRTTYYTPTDENGKKTGPQTKTVETLQNTSNVQKVALNKVVKKKVNGRYVSTVEGYGYNSNRKVVTETKVWTNDTHNTTTSQTDDYIRKYYKKNGKTVGYWSKTGSSKTQKVDNNAGGRASTVTIDRNYNMLDEHNSSVLNDIFAGIHLTYANKQLKVKVTKLDWNNGRELPNSVVLDKTFTAPRDISLSQIGIFFGRSLIHEDKLGAGGYPIHNYDQTEQAVSYIAVYKNLTPDEANPARVIAHKGDTAIIDTQSENVYINDKLANTLTSGFSTFPGLYGGRTDQLTVVPDRSKANITVLWRPSVR